MENKEITATIIGCACNANNNFGVGFLESIYGKSMLLKLRDPDLEVCRQVPTEVTYREETVGDSLSMFFRDCVVVELKVVKESLSPEKNNRQIIQ